MRYIINSVGSMTFHNIDGIQVRAPYACDVDQHREFLRPYVGNAFVLFEGGADIDPARYGETNLYSSWSIHRDRHEFPLYQAARELGIPMLGICRGHQLMCVAAGGTLYQDIHKQIGKHHASPHQIAFTSLAGTCGFYDLMRSNPPVWGRPGSPDVVNSLHHQALKKLPDDATVLAYHEDMTPEAVIYPYGMSVQWHPEFLGHIEFVDYMFDRFVTNDNAANNSRG